MAANDKGFMYQYLLGKVSTRALKMYESLTKKKVSISIR